MNHGISSPFVAFTIVLCAASCAPPPAANLHITPAAWREDLEVVRNELPRRHTNAFHLVSRDAFHAAVTALEAKADDLDVDVRFVGLSRIINMIGDGHTAVRQPLDRAYFPIELREFEGELRIARVAPGLEAALGARVIKVGDTPVHDAIARALELTAQGEHLPLRRYVAALWLSRGITLHGMGLIADRSRVTYTVADDAGRESQLELAAIAPTVSIDQVRWVRPYHQPRLSEQQAGEPFWCVPLSSQRAVYCNFRAYDELPWRAARMVKLVREVAPDRLIIDLRDNEGGDYTVGERNVIRPIARMPAINRKGHLFVLIGTGTFSAAMNNAAQFRTMTAATLVGEPIGEKPNSYQEVREMTLPNSHLVVRYSTEFYEFVKTGPNIVAPDIRIAPTWAQYAAGQDPVLDYALGTTDATR